MARPRLPYLLLLPFFAALLAFWGVPLLEGFRMSLESDALYGPSHFVGLAHYGALVQDDRFRIALWNTARHALLTIVTVLPLGLGLALLLHQASAKAQSTLRFCLLLPALTPPVVLGFLFAEGLISGPDDVALSAGRGGNIRKVCRTSVRAADLTCLCVIAPNGGYPPRRRLTASHNAGCRCASSPWSVRSSPAEWPPASRSTPAAGPAA